MERDFLGLGLKEPLAMVKEERSTEGSQEIGFFEGSGNAWPFTNKVSAVPHLLSFKVAQEEKTKKIASDPLASSAFTTFSKANSVNDPGKKHSVSEVQKLQNSNMQDGGHFSLNAYGMPQDVQSMYRLPVPTNHTISVSMANPAGNPFFSQSQYSATYQGMASTIIMPQVLGGVHVGAQHSTLPSLGHGNGVNVPCSGAQLTIFYAGTVNVYDGVSPEKAQAIMLLAGNGSSTSSSTAKPTVQVHTPAPTPVAVDISPVKQSITASPSSHRSSPISISSNSDSHSGSGSTSTEKVVPAKPAIVAATPVSKLEHSTTIRSMSTTNTITTTTMMPSVPQARKASLTRFLEKRKERVINASPYNIIEKSSDPAPIESNMADAAAAATTAAATGPTTISFFSLQGSRRSQIS